MKAWILIGCLFALFAQTTAFAEPDNPIMERTARRFPSIMDNASPLGKAVQAEMNQMDAVPDFFDDPEGFEKLVAKQAAKLKIAPVKLPPLEAIVLDQRVAAWRLQLQNQKSRNASTNRYYQRKAARDEIAAQARTAAAEQALIELPARLRALEQKQRELEEAASRLRMNTR